MESTDRVSVAMKEEIVRISEERLGKPLHPALKENIYKPWGYMGLEMIMDTVRTMETKELESYLADLDHSTG